MDFKGLSDPVVFHNEPQKKPGFFSKLRPPSTNFINKVGVAIRDKNFLVGGLTVLMLFAIGIGVFVSQKPTQLAPQASSTLDNGLISHWKFDETSGDTAVDSKGIGNATAGGTTIIDGKSNKARQIGSSNSQITAP